jgi:archaellum component FlaC
MAQFEEQAKNMEVEQKELASYREATETRFKDIEDKLGTLVDLFTNVSQGTMQATLTERQGQLAKNTEMLVRMPSEDDAVSDDGTPKLPARKKQRSKHADSQQAGSQEVESMDLHQGPGSQ